MFTFYFITNYLTFASLALISQEEMSGESVVSSAVPAATTRTTSFKGSSPSSKYVKLNVGGALYYTTMQTLTKQDTMLKAMFSGRMEVLTDSEGNYRWYLWAYDVLPCLLLTIVPPSIGWILIDRCGKHFGTILNYLRDGAVPLPDSRRETEELLAEAKYYLVQGLADECTAALQVPSFLSISTKNIADNKTHFIIKSTSHSTVICCQIVELWLEWPLPIHCLCHLLPLGGLIPILHFSFANVAFLVDV